MSNNQWLEKQFFLLLICAMFFGMISCGEQSDKEDVTDNDTESESLNPIQKLNKKIDTEGVSPALLYERANMFWEQGQTNAANQDLFMLMQMDSNHLQGHLLLAEVYLQKLNSQMALQTLNRASLLYPDSANVLLKLAETQLILKQYEPSLQSIGKVLEKNPGNGKALMLLGMNYQDRGQQEKAIASFQSAVEADPTLVEVWIMLGNYMQDVNPKLAAQYFDNAVRMGPENIAAIHSKAFYLQNSERIPEAIELYQQINELDPSYQDAYLNAAILFLFQDSLAPAKVALDNLLKLDKTHAFGHFYMGKYYELNGTPEDAQLSYQEALKWRPSFERAKEAIQNLEN